MRKDWRLEVYTSLFSYQNCRQIFNRKVKFRIPHINNKINIDYINNELEKNISTSKQRAKEYHDKQHHVKNISLQIGDRVMVKLIKLNKLTPIFEPLPVIVMSTKGTLIKAKAEISDRLVTTKISNVRIIPIDAAFPNR